MRSGVLVAMIWLFGCFLGPAQAQILVPGQANEVDRTGLIQRLSDADVVILGEIHDNPEHHENQAWVVRELAPGALVVEMLKASDEAPIRMHLDEGGDWAGVAAPFQRAHTIVGLRR